MNKDLVVEKAREVILDFHAYGINAVLRKAGSGWIYDEFLCDVAELEKALGGKAEWYEFHPMGVEREAETKQGE